MSYLLDTNVVSEPIKRTPNQAVLGWIASSSPSDLYLSAATIAELQYGIEAVPAGLRQTALREWYAEAIMRAQVLSIDRAVAEIWGRLRRSAELMGRTMPTVDACIAATAEVHGLTLVTRNVRDFEMWGGPVFNPWAEVS